MYKVSTGGAYVGFEIVGISWQGKSIAAVGKGAWEAGVG